MQTKVNGAASSLETLTGNIQYYTVYARSPGAFSDPDNASEINIRVTKNFRDESQKNFEVMVQAIGLRAMPVILTNPTPVSSLEEAGAPTMSGEGFVWKFASELEFVYENFGPRGTVGPVGHLIDELHGIVLPSGAVIRTRYVPNNECNTGCGDINTQTVNVEFIRTEYL